MKGVRLALALTVAAGPLLADDAVPVPSNFQSGEVDFGAQAVNEDTNSSKFNEYRDIQNGFVIPLFRLDGQTDGFRYDLFGSNLRQRDGAYRVGLEKGWFRLDGDYQFIPHNYGNGAKSLENGVGDGVFVVSDALQAFNQAAIAKTNNTTYPFVNALVQPSLAAATPFDLDFNRQRANGLITLSPSPSVSVKVGYFNEQKRGYREGFGTSFGFSNAVETPDDTHYLTQDVGADAELSGEWGVARAGVHYNWFRDSAPTQSFDNPFLATDSIGSSLLLGPSRGMIAQPPDSNAIVGSAGTTLKLGKTTRLSADFSHSTWNQDETPFIPYSTNSAITTPVVATDPAALPARALAGKIDVTAFNAAFSTRPTDRLTFNARYRLYDLANDTGRITFPGYVPFDGSWNATPRISVPYGYKDQRLDATLGYDLGAFTLEAGYKYDGMDRDFRETDKTTENTLHLAADVRRSWFVAHGGYEFGSRGFSGLEIERSEDASFVNPGTPTNIFATPSDQLCPAGVVCNLRYDQAPRHLDKAFALVQLTPADRWSFDLAYTYEKSKYEDSAFGLQSARYDSFTVEADYTPSAKWNVYAFYTREGNADSLLGRQSGSTISVNPLDDWTSNVDDKINSVGAGATITIVPQKWTATLFARWQDVDGNNAFFAPVGGAPYNGRVDVGGVQSIPNYDDTKLTSVSAELKYGLQRWAFSLGGWFERYHIDDSGTEGLSNYIPSQFFLNANNGSYQAVWGYVRASYRW
jgi:Putative outer membrane beta-barrel porin, MtrB/PioB